MHKPDTPSWRFGHGDMGYLHSAVRVRDAAGLTVAAADDIPPQLAEPVPDRHDMLAAGDRTEASRQWVVWWRRLVSQAVREAQQTWTDPPGDDFESVIRHRFAGREEVFDPPDFASLADMPPLRSAVRAVFGLPPDRSKSWRRATDYRMFEPRLVRDAAERAAADLRVPIGAVAGYAHVLEVNGSWWCLAGPGCVLCSPEAASDPATAARILSEVFSSGQSPAEAGPA